MRAPMRADGMTCRSGYSPVVTTGRSGTERIVGGQHSVVAGVETTVVTATRGRWVLPRPSEWSWASEWLCLSGETVETCTSTSPASLVKKASNASARDSGTGDKLGKIRVVDCGKHVHYWSSPQSEYQIHDFGVETPLCYDGLVWPKQSDCYHI